MSRTSDKNHPKVQGCSQTTGPAAGRDPTCTIDLEEILAGEMSIIHDDCGNAFHLSCLDDLVSAANLDDDLDPYGANSQIPGRLFAKCPICRGELWPHPKQGCELPPVFAVERERARFEAAYRAAAASTDPVFGGNVANFGAGSPPEDPAIAQWFINNAEMGWFGTPFEVENALLQIRMYRSTSRPQPLHDELTFGSSRFWQLALTSDNWPQMLTAFHETTEVHRAMGHQSRGTLDLLIGWVWTVREYHNDVSEHFGVRLEDPPERIEAETPEDVAFSRYGFLLDANSADYPYLGIDDFISNTIQGLNDTPAEVVEAIHHVIAYCLQNRPAAIRNVTFLSMQFWTLAFSSDDQPGLVRQFHETTQLHARGGPESEAALNRLMADVAAIREEHWQQVFEASMMMEN